MKREQKAENTVTHWCVCGCESMCMCLDARLTRGTEKFSGLIYKTNRTRCCPIAKDNASRL